MSIILYSRGNLSKFISRKFYKLSCDPFSNSLTLRKYASGKKAYRSIRNHLLTYASAISFLLKTFLARYWVYLTGVLNIRIISTMKTASK